MLERDEGYEESVYQDSMNGACKTCGHSLGFYTIGIGKMVDKRKGGKLDRDIIYKILSTDISKHTADLYNGFPFAMELDEPRRAVLICMCFQLGIQRLSEFRNAMGYMKNGEYTAASLAFADSKVAKEQAPVRWARFCQQLKTGEWQ